MPKPKPTHRISRVAELIQREIGHLLITEINDNRLKKVTLSHVKMSPDLRHARISFTVLDEKDAKYSAKALNCVSFLIYFLSMIKNYMMRKIWLL
jgi:ribosome-binding factor A